MTAHPVTFPSSGQFSGQLSGPAAITITVRGRFAVSSADGRDLTPGYRKERALLALLALAPGRRCTRAWLQAMLWSEKPPDKASANLRRALANLRLTLGPAEEVLKASRIDIWLDDSVTVDSTPKGTGPQELLAQIEAAEAL